MKTIVILKHLAVLEADLDKVIPSNLDFLNGPIIRKVFKSLADGTDVSNMEERVINSLQLDLDLTAIKKAYKKIAKKLHPDKGGDPEAFRVMALSYKVLTDPSFSYNIEEAENIDLTVHLPLHIDFMVALFGKTLTLAVTLAELSSEGTIKAIGEKDQNPKMNAGILNIRIPRCTLTGNTIMVPKAGLIYMEQVGDLILELKVSPDPIYTLSKNGDLLRDFLVPLDIMLTGGELDLATPFGLKTITVPPGSRPDQKITVKEIVPKEDPEDKKGDLILNLVVDYPEKPILKKKPIWQRLGIKWDDLAENMRSREDIDDEIAKIIGMK